MPVNLADMMTVGVVLSSPLMAGAMAVQRHTGWYIPVFIAGGLLAGAGFGYLAHFVAYRLFRTDASSPPWRQWMANLAYLFGPLIFAMGGLAFVVWASDSLASRIH